MAEQEAQDKTEEPTPFKLARARRKGTVARGQDLGFLTGLTAFTAFAWLEGAQAVGQIGQAVRNAFVSASTVAGGSTEMLAVTSIVLTSAIRPVTFMAACILAVVLVFEIIQTGFVFTAETFKPDFSRLNPAQNLKRFASPRLLLETGKNVLKLALYASLAGAILWQIYRVQTVSVTDAIALGRSMAQTGLRLLVLFVAAAALFAIVDQLIVRRQFIKQMRMTRRELQREVKEREGDARQKKVRKQLHAEFVKQSRSLRGIKGADVIITNPVHYAVALRYQPQTMAAPLVVSRGAHALARRLKRLAFIYGVTVVEDPPLARALYRACELNQQVPEAHYQAVADIYLNIRKRMAARRHGVTNV